MSQMHDETPSKTPGWLGPKPWAECSDSEKIERLRDQVDAWRREAARLRGRVNLLEQHKHAGDGSVLVDLQQADRTMQQEYACGSINML